MAEVTVDDVLVGSRDFLANPANVVENLDVVMEDSAGYPVYGPEEAACGCFLGAFEIVAFRLGMTDREERYGFQTEIEGVVRPFLPPAPNGDTDPFTAVLKRDGHEGCVAVLDRVIAQRRAAANA